jgi:'Cold-shock' DNA-binding domain
MNNTRILKNKINELLEKTDKNGNDYLILKLDNDESVFVFSSKVKEERWSGLKENQEYNFTVEEGNNGSNLLVDFEIEV